MRKRSLIVSGLGLVALFMMTSAPALAQSAAGDWSITNFANWLNVQPNGVLAVEERIGINLGDAQGHVIYRDLPYAYREADGSVSYVKVEVKLVAIDGRVVQYVLEQGASSSRIRIDSPSQNISGPHTLILRYEVSGALHSYPDYDELRWNVTGNDWGVPIPHISAEVSLSAPEPGLSSGASSPPEGSLKIVRTSCYAGLPGSKEQCSVSRLNSGRQAWFEEQRTLPPGEEFVMAVGFTKGAIPILERSRSEVAGTRSLGPIATFISGIVLLVAALWLIFRRRRQKDPDQ